MKKIVSLVLIFVFLSMNLTVVLAEPNTNVPGAVYSDGYARGYEKDHGKIKEDLERAGVKDLTADHWAAGSVTVLVEAGLLAPDSSGNLNVDSAVNAGEGIAVFAKVLGIASKTDDAATAAAKAQQAGLVDKTDIERDMSRVEVARLIAKAMGIQPKLFVEKANYPFNDFDSTSAEDRAILASLYELGIFKGYPDRTFRPDGVLTKAQIAILIDRILGGN